MSLTDGEDPLRLLAALADAEGGSLTVYAGDMDALPESARPGIRRETVVTASRPEGYEIIVITYPPGEDAGSGKMSLTDTDRDTIAQARYLGPMLRASSSDRDRMAGWLLKELADLAERLEADLMPKDDDWKAQIRILPDETVTRRVRAEYGGRTTAWPVMQPVTLAELVAEFEDVAAAELDRLKAEAVNTMGDAAPDDSGGAH